MSDTKQPAALYFIVTLVFPRSSGREDGRMYMTEEFRYTVRGPILPSAWDTRETVIDEILVLVVNEAWEAYRAEYDPEGLLPKRSVLPEPLILFFDLAPNGI